MSEKICDIMLSPAKSLGCTALIVLTLALGMGRSAAAAEGIGRVSGVLHSGPPCDQGRSDRRASI